MPTYKNNTASPITPIGGPTYEAGEEKTINRYYTDANGLTITAHNNAPWVKLSAASLPISITSGLSKYGQIIIINGSDNTITVTANGDSTNVFTLSAGAVWPIEQDHEFDSLELTGSGSGTITVLGLR